MARALCVRFLNLDLLERCGAEEVIEINGVNRFGVRVAMNSRLGEVDALRPLRLYLLIQDHHAVPPELDIAFGRIFRPMNVHSQLMPLADGEIPLPMNALSAQVARAVLDERAGPVLLRLYPPRHHVVVARRRAAFPVEEIVAILGRIFHVHVKRHEGVGPLLDRDFGPIGLDAQLPRIEDVVFVDRESAGVFAGVNDIGDDLDMPRFDVLALAAELTEVAGFEVGLEENLGRCRFEPEKRA